MNHFFQTHSACCLAGMLLLASAVTAHAQTTGAAAKYQQECAACHVAYPPGMLPAASWKRVLGGLDKHFGVDASLDEATLRDVSSWVQASAGSFRRVREEPPHDRITLSPWFIRQHDEVSASTFKRASIGSASNCAACHGGAAKGNFNEHEVRIPK